MSSRFDNTNKVTPADNLEQLKNDTIAQGVGVPTLYKKYLPGLLQVHNQAKLKHINLKIVIVPRDPNPIVQLSDVATQIGEAEKAPVTVLVLSPTKTAATSNEIPIYRIDNARDNLNYFTPVTRAESFLKNLSHNYVNWNLITILIIGVFLIAAIIARILNVKTTKLQ